MKKYLPVQKNRFEPFTETDIFKNKSSILKNYYQEKEQYHHIEKELLITGSEIAFDLFIHLNLSYKPLLSASEDSPAKLTEEVLNTVKDGDVVIKKADLPVYREYIKSLEVQPPLDAPDEKIKAAVIKEKTKLVVRNVLSDPYNGTHIKESGKVVEEITSSIINNKNILFNIISLKNKDYYTYLHSTNTAVLSIALGAAAGVSRDRLQSLGVGGLLHDIGKTNIPSDVLNKPGRLTFFEYRMMQNHVMEGEKILKNQPYFPENAMSAVTQHHEKLNGQGYPFNLTGSYITIYGRILALADTYDALTTQRPYKVAHTPFEALSIIVNECEQYDPDLLKTFIKMLGGVED